MTDLVAAHYIPTEKLWYVIFMHTVIAKTKTVEEAETFISEYFKDKD